jgi:hypothetical protein
MPSSRAAPEKLRVVATFAKTVMLVSRSMNTTLLEAGAPCRSIAEQFNHSPS